MAQPQLLQGTWEELSAHADEFAGRDDLLLIVPGTPKTENGQAATGTAAGQSLAEALRGKTGLVSFEPSNLSEETSEKFAALLLDTHRKAQP